MLRKRYTKDVVIQLNFGSLPSICRMRRLPSQAGDGGGLRRADFRPWVQFVLSCGGGADEPGEEIGSTLLKHWIKLIGIESVFYLYSVQILLRESFGRILYCP